MRRLLVLGGSPFQVPAIVHALRQGHYVITCDYLPGNPGHRFSHEYHNVSTTDHAGVLALAREQRVDGVLAYASDPAALTAAYVAEQLGLPGNSVSAIATLVYKNAFRDFLQKNGFNAPAHECASSLVEATQAAKVLSYPLMIKPVDSSGSKGVRRVDHPEQLAVAFHAAMGFSRIGRVVIEKFVTRRGPQIAGDGLCHDGELVFVCVGDENFDSACSPYAPVGESFPGQLTDAHMMILKRELQRLLTLLGIRSLVFNIDAFFDENDRLYILEVGPRSGGNGLPEAIKLYSECDLIDLSVRVSLGIPIERSQCVDARSGFVSTWVLHSRVGGKYAGVRVDPALAGRLVSLCAFAQPGDTVHRFEGSHHALGYALLKFESAAEMANMLQGMSEYLRPLVE